MAETILDPYSGNVVTPTVAIPTIDTSAVYSTPNVTQAMTTPAAAPSLSDPMGLYDYYVAKDPNIVAAQTEYQNAFKELTTARATAREQQTAIENLPQALNVIRGEQAQAGNLASNRLQALSDVAAVTSSKLAALKETATQRYSIAQSQRAELTNLITQYPGAKISYTDTIESAANKIEKYSEQIKKDAYKDELKKVALELGLKTSGSRKELEKRIKKVKKSAISKAEKVADIQYQTALAQLNKLKQSFGTSTTNIADLFGDTKTSGTTSGSSDSLLNYFNNL